MEKFSDRKQINDCLDQGVREGLSANVHKEIWGVKEISAFWLYITIHNYQNSPTAFLKWVNFSVCQLYYNKDE